MGNQFLDQYSLLHYASGVIAYFWGFEPLTFFLAHVGFELAENTRRGYASPGPTIWRQSIGRWCAFYIDSIGKKKAWYKAV